MNITETVSESTRWMASESAVGCTVDGEMVLLNLQSGTYFGLNGVGTEIWNQLTQDKTFGEIKQHLLDRYRVSPERCEAELLSLLANLSERGLIKSRPDGKAE